MNMTATAVGIGTTNPTAPLVVSGGTSSSNTIIIIDNSTNAGTGQGVQLAFQNNSGGVKPMGNMSVVRHNAGNYSSDFVFSPSNDIAATERVRILGDSGNVGIGVANPTSLLQLAPGGTANLVAFYTQYNTDANFAAVSAYNLANGTVTGPSGGDYTFTVGSTSPGSLQIHATGTTIIGGATYKVVLVLKTGAAPGTINLMTGPSNTVLYTLPTLSATTQSISATVTVPAGDTYMYLSVNGTSKNIIYSSTGSISATRLDNVHNGRVGIGTTNPGAPLAVYATTGLNSSIGTFADSVYGSFNFSLNTAVGAYNNFTAAGDALLWVTKGTINTGCITIAPHNSGTIGIRIASTANTFSAGANTHSFVSNSSGTAMMTILGNGNVGIGTANPFCKLDIAGGPIKTYTGSDVARIIMGPSPSGTNLDYCSLIESISSVASNYASILKFYTHGNGTTASDPTLAMTINSAQQVGIGTANPGYTLDVGGGARFYSAGSGTSGSSLIISGVNGNYVYLDTATGVGLGLYWQGVRKAEIGTSGLTVVALSGTGNRAVYSDANGLLTNTASDRTLKTNVQSLTYGLEVVSNLIPVSYNWIDTERFGEQREIGFLAQEVQEYVPEVIGINGDGKLSLDYSKLTSVLVKAIQELSAKNAALEQSLATATANFSSLEARLAALEAK